MARPRVLLLDEPSLGLAPIIINEIFKELTEINRKLGMAILIVEQNAKKALQLSHRAYVIQTGTIIMEGKSDDLLPQSRNRGSLSRRQKEIALNE